MDYELPFLDRNDEFDKLNDIESESNKKKFNVEK